MSAIWYIRRGVGRRYVLIKGVIEGQIYVTSTSADSTLGILLRRTRAIVRFIISMNRTVAPKATSPSSPNVKPWWARRTALYNVN